MSSQPTTSTPGPTQGSQSVPKFVPRRLSKNLIRIGIGYVLVIGAGLGVFYVAKTEVNENRVRDMKAKQEMIQKQAQFPTRLEVLAKEREVERLKVISKS